MFKYPLLLTADTEYARLGISPDATAGGIREAKTEIVNGLDARRRELQKRLAAVDQKLPDLPRMKNTVRELKESEAGGSPKLNTALRDLAEFESKAMLVDGDYRKILKEIGEIELKINAINNLKLDKPDERLKYDLSTPPCALLRLNEDRPAFLVDRKTALFNVRRELSAFIEEEFDMTCYHPSDYTRRVFFEDWEPNDTLDRSEHERE